MMKHLAYFLLFVAVAGLAAAEYEHRRETSRLEQEMLTLREDLKTSTEMNLTCVNLVKDWVKAYNDAFLSKGEVLP